MKTQQKSTHKYKVVKLLVVFGVIVILCVLALNLTFNVPNQAKTVARPLENAFINKGLSKICSLEDNGRGIDNTQPWYTVYLESSTTTDQLEDLAVSIAKENGFELKKAPDGTKGYLGDVVYTGSKNENEGKTELAIAFTNSAPLHACTPKTIRADGQHTAIALELKLPPRK